MRARAAVAGAAAGVIIDGAIEVAVTRDGDYAFVTQEDSLRAAVIPAGLFPREMALEMALEPDGQHLLVTDFSSGQLEAVSIPTIP